jgi:hypothetical protein
VIALAKVVAGGLDLETGDAAADVGADVSDVTRD